MAANLPGSDQLGQRANFDVADGMQLRVYTAHCAVDQASTPLFVKSERKVLQWL